MTEQLKITFAVAVLLSASLAISISGFLIEQKNFSDALYGSIQLMVLEGNFDDLPHPLNWQLQFARFVLPLFTILAVLSLLFRLASKQLSLIKANLFPRETIFIGAGRTARAIARKLPKNSRLLIIDCAIAEEFLNTVGTLHKLLVIKGDATERRLLAKLSLHRSKDIYIFTGDDDRDLNIALTLCELMPNNRSDIARLPRLIIDIDDAVLLNTGLQDERFSDYRNNGGELVWFSAQRQAARELLRQHPVLTTSSIGKTCVHVALVGFGDFQHQVLSQILRTCVYLHVRELHVSIFDADIKNLRRYTQLHPVMSPDFSDNGRMADLLPLANLKFFETKPEVAQPGTLHKALALAGEQHFDCVYVHEDMDYSALNNSQRFVQAMLSLNVTCRVVCILSGTHLQDKDIAQRFVDSASANYQGINIFHCRDALVRPREAYPGEHADKTGLMIHTAYKALFRTLQPGENSWDNFEDHLLSLKEAATNEWRTSLPPTLVWSSRNAADHLSIKLRELGFELDEYPLLDASGKDSFLQNLQSTISNNLNALMELEHRRFIAERLIDGWLYGETTNRPLRINNTLVTYQQLPPEEKVKDEAMIRVVTSLIRCASSDLI
jgi:hypothetical protein